MTSAEPTRRVLIVEQNPIGHHFYYVRLLVDEARRRDQRPVLLTSPQALESREFALHLGASRSEFDVTVLADHPLTLNRIALAAEQAKVDLVVVPDGDALTMRLGRATSAAQRWPEHAPPVSLLVMRDHGQDGRIPALAPLKTIVKTALIRRADSAAGVQIVTLKPSGWHGRSRTAIAIDPVTIVATDQERGAAQSRLRSVGGPDVRWFGVFGALTTRKNLPLIADAIAATGDTSIGFVVMGHFDDGVRDEFEPSLAPLERAGHPVLIEDRWLGDGELDAFIGAVDCVVLAYSNEGPSGLLGKSVASGTKVLTAGARMLRQESRRYPGRAAWTPLSVTTMSRAMASLPRRARLSTTVVSDVDRFAGVFLDLDPASTR